MRTILLTIFCLTLAVAAAAETVRVPLDLGATPLELDPNAAPHVLPFDAGRDLADVTEVRLRLTGSYDDGSSVCWNFGDFGGGTWTYPETVSLVIGLRDGADLPCDAACVLPPASGVTPFDSEFTYGCGIDPLRLALADGVGAVTLSGGGCTHSPVHPEVCTCNVLSTVTSAELVVVLGEGVPTERRDWGAVKSRYR